MFCPSCGFDDNQPTQFCRSCGVDKRALIGTAAGQDTLTTAAASAREEIGRAFAAKIRELRSGEDLEAVTENVLPEIEKFLETPAEKRLRRMRVGTIIMLVGIGAAITFGFLGLSKQNDGDELLFISGMGIVAFCVGFAYFVNGLLFSVVNDKVSELAGSKERETLLASISAAGEMQEPSVFSTTEHTTKHLEEKIPVLRKR